MNEDKDSQAALLFRRNHKHYVHISRESQDTVETCIAEKILEGLCKEHYLSKTELDETLTYLRKH